MTERGKNNCRFWYRQRRLLQYLHSVGRLLIRESLQETLRGEDRKMVKSDAATVDEYLAGLPEERREAMQAVRQVVLDNLPDGYEECMAYGMIGYVVPLSRYPDTYNKQPLGLAALASQKQYMSLYLNNVYDNPETLEWFMSAYTASGKKLNMGKSCVRFKRLDDLPLDVVGQAIARTSVDDFLTSYEESRSKRAGR